MILISDAFHGQKGHHTCPSSFKRPFWEASWDISRDEVKERFNTLAAEQLNSKLRNCESMVRCASLSRAKLYVDMLILCLNFRALGEI